MPYIQQFERQKYALILDSIKNALSPLSNEKKAGELDFLIASIVKIALDGCPRYSEYNLVIRALERYRH